MSGRATGWVLRFFPITTAADRNRKLVLLGVADAANQYGRGARPGIQAIMAEWSFDKATVIRHLNWLKENGWLTETHKGRGRGDASIFDLTKMVADCDPSDDLKTSQSATDNSQERSQSGPGKVAIGQGLTTSPTVENNGSNSSPVALLPPGDGETPATPEERAKVLTDRYWDFVKKETGFEPPVKWPAIRGLILTALKAGFTEQQIRKGLRALFETRRPIMQQTLWDAMVNGSRAAQGRERPRDPSLVTAEALIAQQEREAHEASEAAETGTG